MGIDGRDDDADVWHSAVDMRQDGSLLRCLVHLVETPASDVVHLIKICIVLRNPHLAGRILNADNGLHEVTQTFLNILSHRVQVGGECHAGREGALAVLALALTVKLFPPFAEIAETRLVVHENLVGLAGMIQCLTCHGISRRHVVVILIVETIFLHKLSASHEFLDVDASHRYWKQTHRCQNRITSADVIRHYVRFISLTVRQHLQCAFSFIGDSHDTFASLFLTVFFLDMILQYSECHSGLCRRARLRDNSHRIVFRVEQLYEIRHIILTHVMSSVDDLRVAGVDEMLEMIRQRLYDSTGA